MILVGIMLVLLSGAVLSLVASRFNSNLPRYISLLSLFITVVILGFSWNLSAFPTLFKSGVWMYEFQMIWIPSIGSSIHLAMDGLSYILILLTLIFGIISILASKKTSNEGFYYFNTMLMIVGVVGIFLAIDLFLFFFFWEMMLIPLYLLMVMFGNGTSSKNSFKFLIYTQGSGLLLLFSIICLYVLQGRSTGIYSFDLSKFTGLPINTYLASVLMLCFITTFLVKLPVIPFHGWLTGSFIEAPATALITGLLIKTGAYGIIRFVIPIFPEVAMSYANVALIIGVITILYGAFMAFVQDDLRLIAAYSSISHMGFILLGLFSFNEIAWQGVIVQMIASGISSTALIIIANSLLKRTGTCNINQLGGLWEKVPILSGLGVFFAMASLGLPGMGNFIAEFLILSGTFKVSMTIAIFASIGLVAAAAYSLRIIQKVFVGNKNNDWEITDFSGLEKVIVGSLVVLILWIGLYPQPILNRSKTLIQKTLNIQVPEKENPKPVNKNEASVKVFNY